MQPVTYVTAPPAANRDEEPAWDLPWGTDDPFLAMFAPLSPHEVEFLSRQRRAGFIISSED